MGLVEEIGDIAAGIAAILYLMSKIGPSHIGKDQMRLLSFILMTSTFVVVDAIEEEKRQEEERANRIMITTGAVFQEHYINSNRKRNKISVTEAEGLMMSVKKKRECKHNHARAEECVRQDWIGDDCTFSDRQFEQTFRLTRGTVERLIQACGNHAPAFFCTNSNCAGKPPIAIEVKVLGVLKCVAFGCSGRAFMDYHQMAPNTFTEALKAFFRAVKADSVLQGQYMRYPSPSDIKRITAQHQRVHGVPGMLGCLDCLHVFWKNCPVGWQGQFKNGRYKSASVVAEAMVDHNLWFWHVSVGHAGTNSDTNIWDVSPLLEALLTDDWANTCDFEFVLDGQSFNKLWILVDGIYPSISRFVKTISYPVGAAAKLFAEWQESTRKDVERAFGVMTRKFQILTRPIEYWDLEDIKRIISGCILMHNMMVEVRIERDEAEDVGMYHVVENPLASDERVHERTAVLDGHVRRAIGYQPHNDYVDDHVALTMQRWNGLYSDADHARLQSSMMNHIAAMYLAYKENAHCQTA
jgi:Plant transposon protein